jgi:hypothetical protein
VSETTKPAQTAALKAERASVAAKGRQAETEAAPIRHLAELVGAHTDSERAVRWLIALMVLCCDPLAIALMRRLRRGDKPAPETTFGSQDL